MKIFLRVVFVLCALVLIGAGALGKVSTKDFKNFKPADLKIFKATVISSELSYGRFMNTIEYDVDGRIKTATVFTDSEYEKSSTIKIFLNPNDTDYEVKTIEGAEIFMYIMVKFGTILIVSGIVLIALVIASAVFKKKKSVA